ncbi:hypothetical protein BJ170DRAFT_391322 [Xylariales sp. AK1849]|nr:hypothetical protein BJ170DRAFT_391322 [Xylariales sp. AK1849]
MEGIRGRRAPFTPTSTPNVDVLNSRCQPVWQSGTSPSLLGRLSTCHLAQHQRLWAQYDSQNCFSLEHQRTFASAFGFLWPKSVRALGQRDVLAVWGITGLTEEESRNPATLIVAASLLTCSISSHYACSAARTITVEYPPSNIQFSPTAVSTDHRQSKHPQTYCTPNLFTCPPGHKPDGAAQSGKLGLATRVSTFHFMSRTIVACSFRRPASLQLRIQDGVVHA